MTGLQYLQQHQIAKYDTEQVNDQRWEIVKTRIDRDFPDGTFSFLDVGGGNGRFADRVLSAYPESRGIVIDNARALIDGNTPHPRKELHCASVESVGDVLDQRRVDIVFVNWVLHHLVARSYRETTRYIDSLLTELRQHMSPRGRLSVFENMYDGLLIDNLPGRLVYRLTSSRGLAGLCRRLGANTAGVGCAFGRSGSGSAALASRDTASWHTPTRPAGPPRSRIALCSTWGVSASATSGWRKNKKLKCSIG